MVGGAFFSVTNIICNGICLFWMSVLKRCKFYLQRLVQWLGELRVALQISFVTAQFWIGLLRECSFRTGLPSVFLKWRAYPNAFHAVAWGLFYLFAYESELSTLINKKALPTSLERLLCPEQESNLHYLAITRF